MTEQQRIDAGRAEVVHTTLDIAEGAIVTLEEAAARLGTAFRGANVPLANRELSNFAGSLASLIEATNTVAAVIDVDLSSMSTGSGTAAEVLSDLSVCATALVDAHERGDWLTLADVVEFDVCASLDRWPAVIGALRGRAPALSSPALQAV